MKHLTLTIFIFLAQFGSLLSQPLPLHDWIQEQKSRALLHLRDAISSKEGSPGSVFASPSRNSPNYYYHWVRDAAIAYREIFELRAHEPEMVDQLLQDYITFSRNNQLTENASGGIDGRGLGEPKFHLDGSPFWAPWGRPQNDGPALRAFLLAKYAQELWKEGNSHSVLTLIYRPELPAETILKADLEYVAHHWRDFSFDLWEEVYGDHFYTRMTQWRALEEGAKVALLTQDEGAAIFYRQQAKAIADTLTQFWSLSKNILKATIPFEGSDYQKISDMDTAVILASIEVGASGEPFFVDDERIIKTSLALEKKFAGLYRINGVQQISTGEKLGAAIGRYPEDHYDGYDSQGFGNPWFLTTLAFAEYYYRLANLVLKKPLTLSKTKIKLLLPTSSASFSFRARKKVAEKLFEKGDTFLRRIQFHSNDDGHFSEQIHHRDGTLQGARDLTWSYAAFLSCLRARNEITAP